MRRRAATSLPSPKADIEIEPLGKKDDKSWTKEKDPMEKLLRCASEKNLKEDQITPRTPTRLASSDVSSPGRSEKSSRRKSKRKLAGSLNERRADALFSPNFFKNASRTDSSTPSSAKGSRPSFFSTHGNQSQSKAFPGIPLHVVSEKEMEANLAELNKQIERAQKEVETIQSKEQSLLSRVKELEEREQRLLKSCEQLEEMSLTPQVPAKKSKRKYPSPAVEEDFVAPGMNGGAPGTQTTTRIDLRDIQVCELLGTGASGASVYLVNVGGWCCAMKELPRNVTNESNSEFFEKEMALLYQIPNHPNIARYLFHRKLRGRYCLFMSRYSGTLRDHLEREGLEPLPTRTLIKVAHDVADGLAFLHSLSIMHRDLKSDNVFITVNRTGDIRDIAIGDFDTAKRLGVSMRPKSTVGTAGFMAPEVLNACGRNCYSYSADVFSLGMLMYELMTFQYPYYECKSPIEVSSATLEGREPLLSEEQQTLYASLLPLWRQCIALDPDARPTASDTRDQLQTIRSELNNNRYIRASGHLDSDTPTNSPDVPRREVSQLSSSSTTEDSSDSEAKQKKKKRKKREGSKRIKKLPSKSLPRKKSSDLSASSLPSLKTKAQDDSALGKSDQLNQRLSELLKD